MSFVFTQAEREIFARRELLPPSRWAARHIIVQDGRYKGSPVRMDVSPYLAGVLDKFAERSVQELVVCGSFQIGKTLIKDILLGWCMDYRPGTKMLTMPTKETMERLRDEKLMPLLKGSPLLKRQIYKTRSARVALKNGTNIWLASADSPSHRASITVQEIFMDEEDLYGTPSAVEDFRGRTSSMGRKGKVVRVCQPKGDSTSSIWRGITQDVDLLYCYEVKCPSGTCAAYHLPDVKNITAPGANGKSEKDRLYVRRKLSARYVCPHCGYEWSDYIRDVAVANGRWAPYSWSPEQGFAPAAEVERPRAVGFHIPSILSRNVSLSTIWAKKQEAEASDSPAIKRDYANNVLGEPYTAVELMTDEDKVLALREAWLPPRTVPNGAIALTCGIDMQNLGFWFLVRAWMPSMASFVIDYGSLENWEDVAHLVFGTSYPVLSTQFAPPDENGEVKPLLTGEHMNIWRAAFDTGGTKRKGASISRTEESYLWLRENGGRVIWATKGASRAQPVPVRRTVRERLPSGRPIINGLPLYFIDEGHFKALDFSRMFSEESAQPLRLHSGCDELLARHLSSQQLVREGEKLIWQSVHEEDHLLDCLKLSGAAADVSWTPSLPMLAQAQRREARAAGPRKRKQRTMPEQNSRWG